MENNNPDIESYFQIHSIIGGIADAFRKNKNVAVYEITNEGRYGINFDPWENIPHVSSDPLSASMSAGSEFSIKVTEKTRRGIGLDLDIKGIKFRLDSPKMYRQVDMDESTAHILRRGSRWLVILGTGTTDPGIIRNQINDAFAILHNKKHENNSSLSM